jgi:hypothetical protein
MEFLIFEDNGGGYHWDIVDGAGERLGMREVDVSGHIANFLLGGKIGDEQLGRGARGALSDPGPCRLATPGIATDHHDLGSRFGEPLGRDESDAAVGTGQDDGLVVHVNHVVLRICGC